MKKLLAVFLSLLLGGVGSFSCLAFVPYDSYTYSTQTGEAVAQFCPTPYYPAFPIDKATIGVPLVTPTCMCFDKEGNLNDWWTADDAEQFTQRADKLADHYSSKIVLDTVHANGRYTLGENIADQGGLRVAYTAFKKAEAENPYTEKLDGFTPDQRFYLAYARLWAGNIRDEEILRLTKIDPHSLGNLRTNAALQNIDTFYDAFGIQEGDKMYLAPEERIVIW